MKQILTSIFCLLVSLSSFSQSEALLVEETFNRMPIEEVFDRLKEKYDLQIAYDYTDVAGILIDAKIREKTIADALVQLFDQTGLVYQLKDNRLLIRKEQRSITPSLNTYHFKGTIIDASTNQPLEFATVYEKTTEQGGETNEKGHFEINIKTPEKEGVLVVQYLGYVPRSFKWGATDNLKQLQITLEPKSLDFEEITVVEQLSTINTNTIDGATLINAAKLKTLPSFVGGADIFRSIQLLPGISADDDLSAELRIRGGNGEENMVILDGITLYKVDHYFGIFSAVNSNLVDQVKVYKNAFPVEYGGRTSGVVEFSTTEIEEPKVGLGGEVNLLTSNAYLELPIGKTMNFLLGGRITNKNIANTELFNVLNQSMRSATNTQNFTNNDGGNNNNGGNNNGNNNPPQNTVSRDALLAYEPDFSFYDFNAKWTWNVGDQTRVAANYFQGYDKFGYTYNQEYTVGSSNKRQTSREENYSEIGNWKNKGWSVQAQHAWSNKLSSNLTISNSSFEDEQLIVGTLTSVELKKDPRPGSGPIVRGSEDTTHISNSIYNKINGLHLNLKNNWIIDEQQEVVFGYNLINNEVAYNLEVDEKSILEDTPSAIQHAVYGQYRLKAMENKLQLGVGLRAVTYGLTDPIYYSPRFLLSYQATEAVQFKSSWSQYHQFLRSSSYENRFGRTYDFYALANDKRFPVSSSINWMVGFNFLNDWFELDVELYKKNTDGILEYALTNIGLDAEGDNQERKYTLYDGERIAKGIDVLLKKSVKNYAAWLSYTLSETTNSFKEIKMGTPYTARDDRRHQLKLVNQYRYKQFDFSATYIYSSGKPYTDLSKFTESLQDRQGETDFLSYLDSYQRVDVGASYRFSWRKSEGVIGLSVFNLFNRKNVKYRQYVLSVRDLENTGSNNNPPRNSVLGTELQMLARTPNVTFSLRF